MTNEKTKVKTDKTYKIAKKGLTQTKKQLQDMCTAANISRTGNKSELAANG